MCTVVQVGYYRAGIEKANKNDSRVAVQAFDWIEGGDRTTKRLVAAFGLYDISCNLNCVCFDRDCVASIECGKLFSTSLEYVTNVFNDAIQWFS